jgi:uncharacterized membrane protein
VQPAVGEIAIADVNTATLNNFGTPVTLNTATIAHLLLVDVTGKADIKLGGATWQTAPFSAADIAQGRIKTVSTNDLTQGIASSLLKTIDLRVGGLNLSPLTATVGVALTPVAPTVDALVDQLTGLLGVHVGQADVRVDGVRCGKPVLVG